MTTKSDLSFLAWLFVVLAFASKLSFAFLGFVPSQLGFVIFQHGIHPYLNVFLCFSLGVLIVLKAAQQGLGFSRIIQKFHPLYRWCVYLILIVLSTQTILQLIFLPDMNVGLNLATLASTILLILIGGVYVPALLPMDEFIDRVAVLCWGLVLVSLGLYIAGFPEVFKGNRFIGVFKHIPYMVTCASVGFLFNLNRWRKGEGILRLCFLAIQQALFFVALYLTGTRSALTALLIGTSLQYLMYRSFSPHFRMLRVLSVWLMILAGLLFGGEALEYGKAVLTGEKSIGLREAQDGISDRMDEVYRGLDLLEKSPHLGLGLLSKFSSDDAEDVVGSYNSFQDPHNLFISSALIAGWPFALIVIFAFSCLTLRTIFAVFKEDPPHLTMGVYILSHLPILFIYHMHLSLGGLADRMYWICFGYLGLHFLQKGMKKI